MTFPSENVTGGDAGTETLNGDGTNPPRFSVSDIIDAPDYSTLISGKRDSPIAKEYAKKTRSALKSGVKGSIATQQFADAAAILKYGPALASAVGDLADQDEKARGLIDMVTAPDNPWVVCLVTGLPLVFQFMRNHEEDFGQVKTNWRTRKQRRKERAAQEDGAPQRKPLFTLKLGKRQIPIRLKLHMPNLKSRSQPPDLLTAEVFGDPKVQTALERMGIIVRAKEPDQ